jgi:hypothetical protein
MAASEAPVPALAIRSPSTMPGHQRGPQRRKTNRLSPVGAHTSVTLGAMLDVARPSRAAAP